MDEDYESDFEPENIPDVETLKRWTAALKRFPPEPTPTLEPGIWTTYYGKKVPVSEMTDLHLHNALVMMDRILAEECENHEYQQARYNMLAAEIARRKADTEVRAKFEARQEAIQQRYPK